MKGWHLYTLGVLLIIISFFTGPLGILISLTGLGIPPMWLQALLVILWTLALVGFKQVLNTKYKFSKSDNYLYAFLGLTIANFLVRSFQQSLLVNKPLEFLALIVMVLTPVSALVFYISILKAKNIWLSLFAGIGIFISTIGVIEQGAIFLLAFTRSVGYVDEFVIGKMASGALVSYIKMVQNWFLGGILIGGGLSKAKKKK